MVLRSILLALFVLAGAVTPQAAAAEMALETFENDPAFRWQFFTDGVMGGISSGELTFEEERGNVHARMTGEVSTANNGGFIQMRTERRAWMQPVCASSCVEAMARITCMSGRRTRVCRGNSTRRASMSRRHGPKSGFRSTHSRPGAGCFGRG